MTSDAHDPRSITESLRRANACQQAGQFQESESICRQILSADPNNVRAWQILGLIAHQCGEHDTAIAHINWALELQPDYAEGYNNLGAVLEVVGRFDEAVACCRQALSLRPDYAAAHFNLGYVLNSQGSFDAAAACYSRALELRPDFVKAHFHQATLALLRGDFERGWPGYEWRWKLGELQPREFLQPRWRGEPLSGKTILIYEEQGFGDTFQFIRYAALLKELGATVVVECFTPLVPLLESCPGIDRLVGQGAELPPFDFHSPLLSLPGILGTNLDTIPAAIPYLFANAALCAEWREKLAPEQGFRVGINWQGRPGQGAFRRRDLPLSSFAPLAQIPGVRLINLYKGAGWQEPTENSVCFSLVDLGADIDAAHGAFMDTAAIMMNLDLVITCDAAIAHLAGALGVPVWTALPFVPDWRWLLEREDSPWYPTMRLFRQTTCGDWMPVFERMQKALRDQCL